jgi:hypothetical protein
MPSQHLTFARLRASALFFFRRSLQRTGTVQIYKQFFFFLGNPGSGEREDEQELK